MNWFDQNDSDDEGDAEETNGASYHKEEDDEDPLDAYMKSLETSSTATTTASSATPRPEPLNLINQDEATSHWKTAVKKKKCGNDLAASIGCSSQQHRTAQQALASTFHRAGDSKTQMDADAATDSDDEGRKKKRQSQFEAQLLLDPKQQHQSTYEAFQKQFWTPTETALGRSWRQEHSITSHPITMDPILDFAQLQSIVGDTMLQAITKRYSHPTLVQSQTLPMALSGKDVIVTAATGSGKTLAYVWPMIVHVCDQRPLELGESGPIGLIVVPTRELAQQVHAHVRTFFQTQEHAKSLCVIGGTSKYHLVQQLKHQHGVDIVVATPGRFLDVLNVVQKDKGGMTLQRTTMIVLDEADKMLDMGFEQQCTEILRNTRPDRQTLLLSATMGRKVEKVAHNWLQSNNVVRLSIGRTGASSQHVQQHVMVLPSYHAKKQWIMEMLPVLANVGKTLVFVNTRADCELLAELIRQGAKTAASTEESSSTIVETLHGDKHQSDRNKALKAFSKGKLGALICTDVAARGLDVRDVSTVVNFDPAKTLDAHVHRIGRAGRLQRDRDEHQKGVAYTLLVTPKNADFAHVLMNAFQREGREVTAELTQLANKSRRSGNVAARTKWNKAGLGFHEDDPSSFCGATSVGAAQVQGQSTGSLHHYGTLSTMDAVAPPPAKRSRWG